MKIAGIDINLIESGALGEGQMLAYSGGYIYGWDLAKDGGDTCVTARMLPDGRLEIVEVTHSTPADQDNRRTDV